MTINFHLISYFVVQNKFGGCQRVGKGRMPAPALPCNNFKNLIKNVHPQMRCFPQTSARHHIACRHGVVVSSNGAESNSFDSIWAPISTPAKRTANFVKTQSGIPTSNVPIPSNPCSTCSGTGKTTCGACR